MMQTGTNRCERNQILLFLEDRLPSPEREQFESHLTNCDTCRERLENSAAEPDLWREAHEYLSTSSSHPWDGNASTQRASASSQPSVDIDDEAESSAASNEQMLIAGVLAILSPTDDPQMMGRLAGYEIAGIVGQGGMGVVLKGLDVALNRYVAIKLLAPHLSINGAARQRFAREAQAAAAVVHDNVIAIHGVSQWNGHPYLVMPYFRGHSLQRRLDDRGPLALVEILRIGMQTAAGLAAAHAQGIVHRDIKPANILLEDGVERVKLTDFGLARAIDDATLTRTGVIAGTPQYMSPEQALGEPLDARSDLFSLGSVMYAMCTGRPPFRAENPIAILRRIIDTPHRPVHQINEQIPVWLSMIVDRLLAKQANDRFHSAQDVADLLEQCLAHVQHPATEDLPDELVHVNKRQMGRTFHYGYLFRLAACLVVILAISQWPSSTNLNRSTPGSHSQGLQTSSQSIADNAKPPSTSDESVQAIDGHAWDDGVGASLLEIDRGLQELEANVFRDAPK